MHISLDSALGQQRRLNQVGESITQIAPDPAAAYSLRSLTGGDPKVVRVRRASDNHEQDFTASDVSSGALQDFVNAQVVAPLDIQALSATGRDGDFLIAKAAYSLRSLGTRQATIPNDAAPLNEDTVVPASGKYVVQVRRSSDDALKSFTATEVTDGTLLSFVNQIQTVGTAVNGTGSVDNYTLTNVSTTGFSADNSAGGTGSAGFPYVFKNGDVIVVKYTVTNFSSTSSLSPVLRGTSSTSSTAQRASGGNAFTANGTYTDTLTATVDGTHLMFADANTGSYTISAFEIVSHSSNGFVKTWYDQSVSDQAGTATGNHATQSTASKQPKIVSAGSLLNELDFDGTEDMALATGSFSLTQAYTTFSVSHTDDASTSQGVWSTASSITGAFNAVSLFRNDDGFAVNSGTTITTAGTIDYVADRTYLQTNVVNGASSSIFVDGATGVTGNAGSNNPSGILILGFYRVSSANANLDGGIKELIIYDSDQTDNRTAIEANIGEAYSIDLPSGVDPGFDQVDGFVETWYDQSGNGNNAVQATAGNQPKIVNAGSLLTAGVTFDGSDDHFDFTEISNTGAFSLFIASNITNNGGMALGDSSGNGNYVRYEANDVVCKIAGSEYDFGDSRDTSLDIINLNRDGSNSLSATRNSSAMGSPQTATGTFDTDLIGVRNNHVNPITGAIKELLIYSSDQSSNRSAVEANIMTEYSIS
jgi:hypothetical protein